MGKLLLINNPDSITNLIIEMEKFALDKWINGDPSGFIGISDKEITYFEPMIERRLDGIENLTKHYEKIRSEIKVEKYELISPKVQLVDRIAILTFNLISYIGETSNAWNCTEVYRYNNNNEWRIIQSHWSFTKPSLK